MSFSSEVKDEVLRIRFKSSLEKTAQLCALTNSAGSITFGLGGKVGINYTTEHHGVGKLIAQLATGLYDVQSVIAVRQHASRPKVRLTLVRLTGEGCRKLLLDLGILKETDSQYELSRAVPKAFTADKKARKALLTGAFLGCGSIVSPAKGYHLEFACNSEDFALTIQAVLHSFDLEAKIAARKGNFMVYLKESEKISDFLALIGANASTLKFENARVVRNMRNYINRTSNCETANLQKTVQASVSQIECINTLKRKIGLEKLTQPLREMAELRLNNPDATLLELAELSGVSRSGVNYRLTKLIQMAHDVEN